MPEVKLPARPSMHFTPQRGWINDPNGLVYFQGQYHLFAQHYPDDTRWGPMHWLHAVSDDLVSWQELPIALYPDQDGMIFSGSAWFDADNLSGLGTAGKPPLLLLYTRAGDHKTQDQRLAWSTDGVHFEKYANNPVIANPGQVDFRDPKIFRSPLHSGFFVAIAAGDRIEFYHSANFLDWQMTGSFGPIDGPEPGVWECPDLLPFKSEDGSWSWVLIISIFRPKEIGGPRTTYFVGDFDGATFTCTEPATEPVWLDPGFDNYASVGFNQLEAAGQDSPLVIGWGNNWSYATQNPSAGYCGQMTYPRRLTLRTTTKGPRLAATLWPPIENQLKNEIRVMGKQVQLASDVGCLTLKADGPFAAAIRNEAGETFRFGLTVTNHIFLDRSQATQNPFWPPENAAVLTSLEIPRLVAGPCQLTVFIDRTCLEMIADDGLIACHQLVFPQQPYTECLVEGEAVILSFFGFLP